MDQPRYSLLPEYPAQKGTQSACHLDRKNMLSPHHHWCGDNSLRRAGVLAGGIRCAESASYQ
jgi:hypothetical protein